MTYNKKKIFFIWFNLQFFISFIYLLLRASPGAHRGPRSTYTTATAAVSLQHNHNNTRSKPCLQPTPQLTETPAILQLKKKRIRREVLQFYSRI